MIISLKWLNEYVSLENMKAQDLAKILTSLGLEVESVKETAQLDPLIVVGKIVSADKHPNADSLKLCKVDVGSENILSIVCGGRNAREGIFVAVAQKGAVLPDGLKIKASKIRGEASEGMLCSEKELGFADDSDGILEWSAAPKDLGTPVSSVMQNSDAVLEVSVTPNRSDCNSYIGIARDIAAKLKLPLKTPEIPTLQTGNNPLSIHIENPEHCARFCAVRIQNVKAITSPKWMQERLEASGMKSINLLVDATNYVMLEYGQPLHAYDRRFIEGDTLLASSGQSGNYQTLDGSEIVLDHNDLLISDAHKIVGLAGVMGGKNSEIKDDTTDIIIEAAHFSMQKVRKTARRLGIHSEASYRFERGIDIEAIPQVLKRVSALIINSLAEHKIHAEIASEFKDVYPHPRTVHQVALRLPRVRSMIANPLYKLEQCSAHLESLGFVLSDHKDERMLFEVPSWRNDILREIDLIEEVARLEGLDSIPYELPRMHIAGQKEDPYLEFAIKIKQSAAILGLNEVMTYPFTGKDDYEKLQIPEGHGLWPTVSLANALNEKQAFMQTSLLPGLFHALARNRNRGSKGVKLFEVARTYFSADSSKWAEGGEDWKRFLRPSRLLSAKAKAEPGRVIERETFAAILDQPFFEKEWDKKETASNFYHGKEFVCSLLRTFGITKFDFVPCDPQWFPFVHPNASAWIIVGRDRVGWVGEIHPQTAHAFDLGSDAPVCFGFDLEALFDVHERQTYKIKQAPRFQAVTRDLALLLAKAVSYKEFETQVLKFPGKKHLTQCRLFDLYEGEQIKEGMKSIAVTCTFQSTERTLTDEDVDSELNTLLKHLQTKLGAVQR